MHCSIIASINSKVSEKELEYLQNVKKQNGKYLYDIYPDLKKIIDHIDSKQLRKTQKIL
tara:strand:+ start:685 stop:861 length:177 start_codon:yes stop_codon:yes gene_type:complete